MATKKRVKKAVAAPELEPVSEVSPELAPVEAVSEPEPVVRKSAAERMPKEKECVNCVKYNATTLRCAINSAWIAVQPNWSCRHFSE